MNVIMRCLAAALVLALLTGNLQPALALSEAKMFQEAAQGSSSSKSQKESLPDLSDASPQQVQDILAAMSDEQVRRLLLATLEQEAKARQTAEPATILGTLQRLRAGIAHLRERVTYVLSGAARATDLLPEAVQEAVSKNQALPTWRLLLGLAALFVAWVGLQRLLFWKTRSLRQSIATVPESTSWFHKLLRLVVRALLEAALLALVVFGVLLFYQAAFNDTSSARPLLLLFLVVTLLFEAGMLLARFLFAPNAPGLRLLPLSDAAARRLYRILIVIGLEIAVGLIAGGLVQFAGSSEALYLAVIGGTGLVVALTISMLAIWQHREVAAALRETFPKGTLRYQLSGSWHLLLTGYICFFWLFWMGHILAFGSSSLLRGLFTLLAFPTYLLLTWLVDRLAIHAGNMARAALLEKDEDPADPAGDHELDQHGPAATNCPVARFRRFLSRALGVVLFGVFLMALAAIWDIEFPLAQRVVEGAFSVLMTLILAYVLWAFAKAAIERKLRAQAAAAGGQEDAEMGGGTGDRLSTLLELLKRFIFVALVVIVSLIVLSSMGVDTTPLMAGAGVLGLALGFGSQTLVKDIISGAFFLMDDAFRIGDYVVLGEAMGTVEGISVRSLKLRHHRGRLFTVPYGSIKMVDNYSRDWAIMKLEYVVPFDTDIQQVKKIVKRINKEIKEVPELAELMLGDIKSQGVKTMEEYGMRMRIKMTTIPGGQFTLRKWVWGKLRRYFDDAGIEFASKRVSVMLPDDRKLDRNQLQAVGAAAAEAMEEQQDNKAATHKGPS